MTIWELRAISKRREVSEMDEIAKKFLQLLESTCMCIKSETTRQVNPTKPQKIEIMEETALLIWELRAIFFESKFDGLKLGKMG